MFESPKVSCHSDSDSSAFYTYKVTHVGPKQHASHEHICKYKWMVLLQCITKETIIFNKGLWHLKEFYFNICLSKRKFKRLGDPLDEIVTVFVHKYYVIMPRPNMTSFDSRDRLPRRWLLHYLCVYFMWHVSLHEILQCACAYVCVSSTWLGSGRMLVCVCACVCVCIVPD